MKESNPSSSGAQEQLEDFDPWSKDQGTDDDEVLSKEVSTELIAKISGKGMKSGPTVDVLKQMQDALNDIMRSRCNSGEEHHYHLDQMKSYIESQINGNSETRKYILPLHKIHAFSFLENDIEEMNTRWVKRQIKRFNLYARYVVEHWKSLCATQAHIKRQLKQRDNPEELELETYQVKVNLTAPNLIFPEGKKDIDEIPKFYDATLKRVLKNVKNINLDVKHGYADLNLSKDE
ncbi:hypothetical protein Tco_0978969, partial [Tanacetum coccineum]